MGFPGGSDGKESACNAGDPGLILGLEDPLEKGLATHSNILAWRIPRTEEPGGLSPWGCRKTDMAVTNFFSLSYHLSYLSFHRKLPEECLLHSP